MIEVESPKTGISGVDAALKEIDKKYGKGSIISLGDRVGRKIPCIPTGLHTVDWGVLGVGGMPQGRICEIFGPESSGKTTMALRVVAEAQKLKPAAFIDVEHALDPTWADKQGVDVKKLLVSQPDYGEQALDIAETLISSGGFSAVVIDSVAALVPKAELDGEMTDAHMGLQARLMGKAMRKLVAVTSTTGTLVIFINQIREKLGVMFGSPETTTGGRALKFYASVRLDVRRSTAIKEGDLTIGFTTKVKAVKNKCAAPFREAMVPLLFERGFDVYGPVLDAAIEAGYVEKSGSWFSYNGDRMGQGRENAVQYIIDNELIDELREKITPTLEDEDDG